MIPFMPFGRRFRNRRRRGSASHASQTPAHHSERLQDRKLLTSFMVSATADGFDLFPGNGTADDGNGTTSLRAAIQETNALAGSDTIYLTSGTFTLSRDSFDDDTSRFGDLDISGDLTIIGAGADNTIIDANDIDRVFDILAGANVKISGVTIRNGTAQNGAGIRNFGTLVLEDSVVEDNVAEGAFDSVGGGIGNANGSVVTLNRVTVRNNSSENHGGGLYASGARVTITDCIFENNSTENDGGGLSVFNGTLTMTGGALRNNASLQDGGGLSIESVVASMTEVSVSGNTATEGGGGLNVIGSGAELRIYSSTIADNHAAYEGGGIRSVEATLGLIDTTVSGNQTTLNGGGLYSQNSTAEILNSLFATNAAVRDGGGISNTGNSGSLGISNSTFSGNSTLLSGGGIFNDSYAATSLVNVTVTANSAGTYGGGIRSIRSTSLGNTIVAKNTAVRDDYDVSGSYATLGNNLIGRVDYASGLFFGRNNDQMGFSNSLLDPGLSPLADNGGPTLSHRLLSASTAIDAGRSAGAAAFDQTGNARNVDGDRDAVSIVDIGAVEFVNGTVTFSVTTTADTFDVLAADDLAFDSSGNVSLRSAIQETNSIVGAAIIALPAGTYTLTRTGTGENFALTGDLDITDNLTIVGEGADSTIIDAGAIDRIFHVAPSITLTLSGVTIQNGAADFGAGLYNEGGNVILRDVVVTGNTASGTINSHGGGLLNDRGNMVLERVSVSGNTAELDGGGLYNFDASLEIIDSSIDGNTATRFGGGLTLNGGTTSLTDSTISNNSATDDGGGINARPGSTLTLMTTTLRDNVSQQIGGGIYAQSSNVSFLDSTVSGNTSGVDGGGIASDTSSLQLLRSTVYSNSATGAGGGVAIAGGTVSVGQSTISGNAATGNGGAIASYSGSQVNLTNATIVSNSSDTLGGGIWSQGGISIGNTIVAQNTDSFGAPDISGTVVSRGTNIVGIGTGLFGTSNGQQSDAIGTFNSPLDPMLTELLDNGGPTLTHVPRSGSIAIDAGTSISSRTALNLTDSFWLSDQRDRIRVQDGNLDTVTRVDIGATEFASQSLNVAALSNDLLLSRKGDVIQLSDNSSLTTDGIPVVLRQFVAGELDQLELIGTTASESLTIDFSNGNPLPVAGLRLAGTGTTDTDSLTLIGGNAATVTHELDTNVNGILTVDGRRISYTSIESLTELLDVDSRSIAFADSSTGITISDIDNSDDGISLIDRGNYGTPIRIRLGTGDLSLTTGFRNDTVRFESVDAVFTGNVKLDTGAGNDFADLSLLSSSNDLSTGSGNDTVIGGSGDDMINGGMGNDSLFGGDGDDIMMGGGGRDTLYGNNGNDLINAQGGSGDVITGGLGDDTLKGGSGTADRIVEQDNVDFTLTDKSMTGLGNDVLDGIDLAFLTGGSGANRIDASGFSGKVTLDGSTGDDTLIGGSNRDRLVGGSGQDNLDGGSGDDWILGGSGDDFLFGNEGEDTILGEGGNDTLQGGLGNDTLDGGSATDLVFESSNVRSFVLSDAQLKGRGTDTLRRIERAQITGGVSTSVIDGARFSGPATLVGASGEDTVLGG